MPLLFRHWFLRNLFQPRALFKVKFMRDRCNNDRRLVSHPTDIQRSLSHIHDSRVSFYSYTRARVRSHPPPPGFIANQSANLTIRKTPSLEQPVDSAARADDESSTGNKTMPWWQSPGLITEIGRS